MVIADSATSVSSQLDREIKHHRKKDAFFFKANPTFALDHVTVTNRKTGRNILDDLSLSFHAGATHAVLVDAEDREQHQALLATMVGMVRTDRGNVMHKSTNLSDVEPVEMLGHRIGFIPQRFAFRPDLDAESNVLYAMDASNRNFLKPKPVIARELLKRVGFDEVTSGLAVGEVSELNQRRVAIARALSCEAEVIIADEPTAGLDAAAAAAWVVKNIASYGGDPRLIFIAGHSAGGYLTSMIGLDKRWMAPYGIDPDTAFAALIPYSGQVVTHFARRREMGIPDTQVVVDDMAPLNYIRPDCPPILILSGDRGREMLGRYEENAYFWRMMQVAGHPDVEIREFDGFDHGNMPQAGHYVAVRYIRDFVKKLER